MTTSRIAAGVLWMMLVPGFASAQPAGVPQTTGIQEGAPNAIRGTVKDVSGSAVPGAIVTVEKSASTAERTAITDQAGAFRFLSVQPGTYKITIAAAGFSVWKAANVVVDSGDNQPPLSAVLEVAAASTSVSVTVPQHELAAEQLKDEEKQRLLGIFPQFFVNYSSNPIPLTAAQKFQLGWKTITDPVAFIGTGLAAAIQQHRNTYPEFGQGTEGYAKRFGAQYADRVSSVLIGHVAMQSLFHQDPRYFYKGTGSFGARALYAIGNAFVRKGDNGHWQPDYSDVLGGLASSELSTLYYPRSSRPVRRLADGVLLGFASRAASNLLHELVLRKVTTNVHATAAGPAPRVLPEGTAVSLISAEDWSSKTAENAGSVDFILASDLEVDGVTVAAIGSKAWGHATFSGAPGDAPDGTAKRVELDNVRLKVGGADVPLRSTPLPGGGDALEYHRLENSGRVAIVLYVASTVKLAPAR